MTPAEFRELTEGQQVHDSETGLDYIYKGLEQSYHIFTFEGMTIQVPDYELEKYAHRFTVVDPPKEEDKGKEEVQE